MPPLAFPYSQPRPECCYPKILVLTAAGVVLDDVLFGELWLCGGQSVCHAALPAPASTAARPDTLRSEELPEFGVHWHLCG